MLVIIACIVFLLRRDVVKIKRFSGTEMTAWPKLDGRLILFIELFLMSALFIMNATDRPFQASASMPISSFLAPLFDGFSHHSLDIIEKTAWWIHIIGILIFLNYVRLPF